jgi:uncharacterized protein
MIRVGSGGRGVNGDAAGRKIPGRGAYLCPRMECLQSARRSGSLSRRLRETVDEDIYRQVERAIENKQKVSIG